MFTTKEKKAAAQKELDELEARAGNLRKIINEDEKPLRETIKIVDDAYAYLGREQTPQFLKDFAKTVANLTDSKLLIAREAQDDIETVIEAINKQAGFVPDYSNGDQKKWYPYFEWDKSVSAFRFYVALFAYTNADAGSGSRQVLPTEADAIFVGKTFEGLYNTILSTK